MEVELSGSYCCLGSSIHMGIIRERSVFSLTEKCLMLTQTHMWNVYLYICAAIVLYQGFGETSEVNPSYLLRYVTITHFYCEQTIKFTLS